MKSKILGTIIGVLLAVVMLAIIASAMAGLVLLGWNVVAVSVLSIAVPMTYLTALKGIGILYLILLVANVVRSVIQSYMQKMQMNMAMKAMKNFSEQMAKAEGQPPPDILRHFRMS